jgi:hypothetical protein
MTRLRIGLGMLAGLLLILSSAAHSLLGWKQLKAALESTHAPADLVTGLSIGWHFAGVAMLAFGVIVLFTYREALARRPVSLRPVGFIALVYLVFGVWALKVSDLNPFFLVFIVPGLMLAAASWRGGVVTSPVDERR